MSVEPSVVFSCNNRFRKKLKPLIGRTLLNRLARRNGNMERTHYKCTRGRIKTQVHRVPKTERVADARKTAAGIKGVFPLVKFVIARE